MAINIYLQNCRQLLQAFEDTQSKLIMLNIEEAAKDFRIEIQQLEAYFSKMAKELDLQFGVENPMAYLNLMQLNRLMKFLKELKIHLDQLNSMEKKPDHAKIIFFLQRQYKFKQIFRRHLTDYARLTW